jgi:hypothetical protein
MFSNILGLPNGGGRGGDENTLAPVNHDIFNDGDAAANFENVLLPPVGAVTITQPQGGGVPPLSQGGAHVGVQPLGVPLPPPPAGDGHPPPPLPHLPGGGGNVDQQPAVGDKPYSDIGSEMKKLGLGHTMYDPATTKAKLAIQRSIKPTNAKSHLSFRDFAVYVQCFRIYLAMVGGQPHVTMIHTLGAYYSINPTMSAYQGRVLAFIRDRMAMKEPNPVCMPTSKTLEWFSGNAVTNFAAFQDHNATKASCGTLWMPVAGEDTSGAIQVPHLLTIPNVLVDLLRTQGMAITPHKVLMTMGDFIASSLHPIGQQWECICKWCLVAGQSGANGKSKVFLETSPVTIDDNYFDLWVGNRLDISLGPCLGGSPQATSGSAANGGMDYSALLRMLAMTIGTTMMHLNQAVAPQGRGQGLSSNKTALSTGKGFNQDQVAKLKDMCSICNGQQIPAIWSVIQATKGKSFDSYRTHIAKSVDAWCRSHHIDRDKSIFLESKIFKDLVALRFNSGGPVAQYQLVA